jgi:Trp operon repressor
MTTRQRAIAALLDQGWSRSNLSVAFGVSLATIDRETAILRSTARSGESRRKSSESSRSTMLAQLAMAAEG